MIKAAYAGAEQGVLDRVYSPETKAELASHADFFPELITKQNASALREVTQSVEYLFSTWGMPAFADEELAQYFPSLHAVFYAAGSVQFFARPFLNRGIHVFSAWAANAIPVAEYAASAILLANKGFFLSNVLYKRDWFYVAQNYSNSLTGNYGAKVGLLGVGMIGGKVIELLARHRLKVLVFDPFLPPEKAAALGVELAGLERIFSECAVISNHLANNAQTKGMLDYRLFSLMGPRAAFINTGRGAQVIEGDLLRALREEPLRVAILDVTEPEPAREGHPFLGMENVFLTPHIAGSTGAEVSRMGEYVLEEFRRFLAGKPTQYEVTPAMLETMA